MEKYSWSHTYDVIVLIDGHERTFESIFFFKEFIANIIKTNSTGKFFVFFFLVKITEPSSKFFWLLASTLILALQLVRQCTKLLFVERWRLYVLSLIVVSILEFVTRVRIRCSIYSVSFHLTLLTTLRPLSKVRTHRKGINVTMEMPLWSKFHSRC